MTKRFERRIKAIEHRLRPQLAEAWHRWRTTGDLPRDGWTGQQILRAELFLAAADANSWGVELATKRVHEELDGWTDEGRAQLRADVDQRLRRLALARRAFDGDDEARAELGRRS